MWCPQVVFNDSSGSPDLSAIQADEESSYFAESTSFVGFAGEVRSVRLGNITIRASRHKLPRPESLVLFSCSYVLERGEKEPGDRDALGSFSCGLGFVLVAAQSCVCMLSTPNSTFRQQMQGRCCFIASRVHFVATIVVSSKYALAPVAHVY